MEKQKKIHPAKQKIIANYKEQKKIYLEEGYKECPETFSVLTANLMAFVVTAPFMMIAVGGWVLTGGFRKSGYYEMNLLLVFALMIASIFIHELLHGTGWIGISGKSWKSIYIGVMWESLQRAFKSERIFCGSGDAVCRVRRRNISFGSCYRKFYVFFVESF